MPGYKEMTVVSAIASLRNKAVTAKSLQDGIAQAQKTDPQLVETLTGKLVAKQMEAHVELVNLIKACDVAEKNNDVFCKFMITTQGKAKQLMDDATTALEQLENRYDDNKALVLVHKSAALSDLKKALSADDKEFRDSKMLEYRDGWPSELRKVLQVVLPERVSIVEKLETTRKAGIGKSTVAVASKKKLDEYMTRLEVMSKRAEQLERSSQGKEKDFTKLLDEARDFAKQVEQEATKLSQDLKSDGERTQKYVSLAEKALTKETAKVLIDVAPKLEQQRKLFKARVKTLSLQLAALEKGVQVTGERKDRYFGPLWKQVEKRLSEMDDGIAGLVKLQAKVNELVVAGKKLK